ncbi:tripartite tricarboxylate transporter substrate binding protein [Vibrio sp. SCSIO 43137]|uniref:tripartite tricarboxylate transporter substrate binding protein n=1 Tax=Vibrio sp. SCSIO 43137 TaxID=3021011 RepID=UPI002307B39C|nr:tripartite tricarboxylate transporter substrate-binding protein [Vibrio sp. SCSIO 43137]WCE30460.1 tripartite tricarboxylate transporter substrate-binding protein [Vibrio sp. SCSIO 43137]
MKELITRMTAIISLSLLAFSTMASTEQWPKKPITTVVPWAVGGLADQVNRAMAQFGTDEFGQPIIPTNRLGAGGVVALTEYLREKPNTTKIIYGSEGNFSISPKTNKVAYKWEDFTPIMNIYTSSFVLVANPESGITNFEDLKRYGANNKILFGVNGLNGTEFLIISALLSEMGINYEAVGFNGANEAMNATISGDVILSVTHGSLAKEYVKAKELQAILVFDEKPLKTDVYDLPPVTQFGYDTWIVNRMMMLTRNGTDPKLVEAIRSHFLNILENPEFKKVADNLGVNIDPVDGDALREHVETTIEKVDRFWEIAK